MDINEIKQMPTVYDNVHESVYRSYHILAYVKWLLEQNTPAVVVLNIIEALEDAGKDKVVNDGS